MSTAVTLEDIFRRDEICKRFTPAPFCAATRLKISRLYLSHASRYLASISVTPEGISRVTEICKRFTPAPFCAATPAATTVVDTPQKLWPLILCHQCHSFYAINATHSMSSILCHQCHSFYVINATHSMPSIPLILCHQYHSFYAINATHSMSSMPLILCH